MVDIMEHKEIRIIDKSQLLFISQKQLIPSDIFYAFHRQVVKNKTDLYPNTLTEITNIINKNVQFPAKLILGGKPHLFRRKKREYNWKLFPAGKYNEEDIELIMPYSGMLVLVNISLNSDERVYLNDIPIEVNPHNNIIKLVSKNDVIKINSSLSEDDVLLLWFVVYYECSE